MGSGCSKKGYENSCPDANRVSSHCVSWQGEAYPDLGICVSDTLTEVETVVLKKLEQFAEGEGITLNNLTASCTDVQQAIASSDKSLSSIFNYLLENQCTLKQAIADLNVQIDELQNITIDTQCLGDDITTQQQLWTATIQKICDLQESINQITNDLSEGGLNTTINNVIGEALLNKLTNCNGGITKTGTGANVQLTFNAMIPVGGRVWGDFDLTKFDNTGKGVDIYCGWALCNGKNGTPDIRGFVPAMATNISGVAKLFDTPSSVGTSSGTNKLTITSANLPNHTHVTNVNDPGHSHPLVAVGIKKSGVTTSPVWVVDAGADVNVGENTFNNKIQAQPTGLTVTVGGVNNVQNTPIDNRQPTYYGVWIQRIV